MSETPYGTIWARGTRPFGTLGSIRQHPALGVINEGRVMREGRPAGIGEVGELELRNPAVMKGYWGMPEETASVLSADGWLRTGDLVTADPAGTYTFVGRVKEVIRRRGENVAPVEIEEALAGHPDVFEVAVVGVPSELSEEEIKAFVVTAPAADLTAIRARAAGRLAPFKVPRFMEAVAELPHTPTGRVAKHELPSERPAAEIDFDPRGHPRPPPKGRHEHERLASHRDRRHHRRSITIRGRDLAGELMGSMTFTELAFLLVQGTPPTPEQARLLDAVLVSLADHGLTPTVLAARLTYTGAPGVAAGSGRRRPARRAARVFLGVVEDAAVFLERSSPQRRRGRRRPARRGAMPPSPPARAEGGRIPGLGHPIHKVDDPRTPRIYAIAAEAGLLGPNLRRSRWSPRRTRASRAARCRSTAPARAVRRSQTWGSRRGSCAASPCSPAPRAWSRTWPRRWPSRWGCPSSARSTSASRTRPVSTPSSRRPP